MNLTIGDVLKVKHLSAHHIPDADTRKFTGVSTDSRTVRKGELFVAIRGENFDGNRFVKRAFRRGAAAAIVDTRTGRVQAGNKPAVMVRDGAKALGELAAAYRRKFSIPVVAVAGSNGKTTAKEMIGDVLAKKYRVHRTKGNLNNHIGVPMTLFGLRPSHGIAVVEIGTNHFGEVKRLSRMAAPTHGIVTNIGSEHLRFFRDLDGVAKAEGELFDYFGERGGTLFVNADDARLMKLARGVKAVPGGVKKVLYGFTAAASSVRGGRIAIDRKGRASFGVKAGRSKRMRISMPVPGVHNAANGLAAAAVGTEFGVRPAGVRSALGRFRAPGKRMEVLRAGGVTILNDTYNANPASVESALVTLGLFSGGGKRIAVLADMLELGRSAAREHDRIGRAVAGSGITHLFAHGPMAERYCRASKRGSHYSDRRELASALRETVRRGDVVLVKGSRGMKMEEVVEGLVSHLKGKA